MSLHKYKVLRQRSDPYLPLSGSEIASDTTPTASSLAQNTAPIADSSTNPTVIPLVSTSASDTASTAVAHSSSPTAGAASSTSSGNQIPLSAEIAACVAAAVALSLAVLLAIYCSKRQKQFIAYSKSRNAANNSSRRRSHLEAWKPLDDGDGNQRMRPMIQRPPSGPLGAMFHRTNSNTSGNSSERQNQETVGSMQNFVKYHPGLAAEIASRGDIIGVDGQVAKPPPVHQFLGRGSEMTNPVSWDGDTITEHSFISMHSESPVLMATAKATPPATTSSSPHRWESAEVIHVGEVGSKFVEPNELQNPFEDGASSVKSGAKTQNPFFSARDHPIRRRTVASTHENPFADLNAPPDPSPAIQSLIAALEAPGGNQRIVSVQSSVYSGMTGGDGDSAIDVAAFPYPPTQIHLP